MGSSSKADKNTYHLAAEKHLLSRLSAKKTYIVFLARKTTKIQRKKPCKISLLLLLGGGGGGVGMMIGKDGLINMLCCNGAKII